MFPIQLNLKSVFFKLAYEMQVSLWHFLIFILRDLSPTLFSLISLLHPQENSSFDAEMFPTSVTDTF